jgi:hypothetical protein
MFQLSSVQQHIKEKAAQFLTKESGMKVTLGRVDAVFPFYFRIEDLQIHDHHDTLMLSCRSATLLLASINLNTKTLYVNKLKINNIYLNQKKYSDEKLDNLSLFFRNLSQEKKEDKPPSEPFSIRIKRAILKDGTYQNNMRVRRKQEPGIDFDHLGLTEVNADLSNISVKGDVQSFKINRLALAEKSGFRLLNLSGLTDITPSSIRIRRAAIETNQSAVALELSFHYQSFRDFQDFENLVFLRSIIGVTTLSTYDLGYFIPVFYSTNNQINIKGELEGFLSSFSTSNFQFSNGSTSFDGDIVMQGLPDIKETYISLDINHLVADPEDISRFHIYNRGEISGIALPPQIRNLGVVSVTGDFNGKYNDFFSKARFAGGFGSIITDLRLSQSNNSFTILGSLGMEQVNAGQILEMEQFGLVSLDMGIDGSGTLNSWDINLNGMVHSIDFNKYNYQQIEISGKLLDRMFAGDVGIDDKNIKLDFSGILDFNEEIPSYNFSADIQGANLARLNLVNDSVRGLLSTKMTIDIQGNNPDNLAGLVNINYAEFKTPGRNYLLNHFDLSAFTSPENRRKFIAIRSDYLDGDIHGNFSFYDIGYLFTDFVSEYIPGVVHLPDHFMIDSLLNQQNELHFDLTFKNPGNLTQLLTGIRVDAQKLAMYGSYNALSKRIRINGLADAVDVDGVKGMNWYLNIFNKPGGIVIATGTRELMLSDTMSLYEPYWEASINNDLVKSSLSWKFDPSSYISDALIATTFNLKDYPGFILTFDEGSLVINDTLWQIRPGSGISFTNNVLDINNFDFYSSNQSISINGRSSEGSDQAIECNFRQIDISWLDFLTLPHKVDLDGKVNGNLTVRNLLTHPRILADLTIDDFAFNHDPMGSLKLLTLWDDQVKGMRMNADFIYQGNIGSRKTAEITGYIYPFEKKKDNFDLHMDLDNFRINVLSHFLSDITSDVKGFASGKLHLGGPFAAPELSGRLKVNARTLYIDYLNTRYSFADSIFFTPNSIIFNNIQLSDNNRINTRDPYSATLNGTIRHKGFRDFNLNLNIRAENFTFMNTNGQQDPMYFGRALATGNVSVTGPDHDILVTVQARTERNTILEIPLVFESEVTRSSFVTFIDRRDDLEIEQTVARKGSQSNLRLNFNLQVTPDAIVRLIFDPLVGDVIEGSGSGNLLMNINSNGDFDLRGQYVISKGDYTFNLENLISKKFSVKPGGTIRWTGDPYDANIDVEAVYATKASLAPLNMEDSTSGSQNVECVIHMTGKLFDPTIDFKIDFPDLSTFDSDRYQALIRPNLNYHFLSLLAISRFANVQSQQFLEAGSSANIVGINSTELLANQLSIWLSNISDDFDVDFAYHPGTGLSPEQVEAAFKTQVLNDKLIIESKVGIGGRTYAGEAQRTSNMVGDIVAEYRIDREGKFRVKAFNRYNEQNILYEGAPYTQGIGVFYRKEFNSFSELLKRRGKRQE